MRAASRSHLAEAPTALETGGHACQCYSAFADAYRWFKPMLSAFPSEPLWSLLNCPYIFASHPPAACSSGLWPGTSHVTHSPGRVKGTQLKELVCVVNPQSCFGTSSSCLHSGRLATTPASFQPAFSASQLLLQCETSAHSLRSSRSASPLMTPKCKFLTIVSDQFLTVALSPQHAPP